MSNKAPGLKSAIDAFIQRRGIEADMDQNLMKEAIHLHLLSALSETSAASRFSSPTRCGCAGMRR